ncbi:hypothetical protein LTR09_003867 [Extremus antarcticus]|uniref:Histone chaperone RTT106/FACT complex subunit SPT16-like middle domain-containing protein n=1 Tax=Extremus antarcticus TaxID=702011 RepID=A0AAJ0DJX9_9PEZI|nr:hypothetical protein LTR09_003867 [Extremus antarcticus]
MANAEDIGRQCLSAVQSAFPKELSNRILLEIGHEQRFFPLFVEISNYVSSVQGPRGATQDLPTNTKKRKLEDGSSAGQQPQQNGATLHGVSKPVISFECKDVSVQIPARKKLKVSLVRDEQDSRRAEVRLLNQSTDAIECALQSDQIEEVFAMHVPDKTVRQAYIAIIPKAGALSTKRTPAEQILFTLAETLPPASATSIDIAFAEDDTHVSVTEKALEQLLAPLGKRITRPDAAEFASSRPQPHRKGEKAYHVNAHRGSKEGYLYFLPTGILFGFKKPLTFFPFSAIDSISYTSVLQRTFNLVIAATDSADSNAPDDVKQVEFSMLDQEDFANIDDYIKRHGLNDASMAKERRAKVHNVNKEVKKEEGVNGAAEAGGVDEDGLTELQKAEQQLQDEEDEEEEDYEASGGESDGEGAESGGESEDGEEYDEEEGDEEEGEEVT